MHLSKPGVNKIYKTAPAQPYKHLILICISYLLIFSRCLMEYIQMMNFELFFSGLSKGFNSLNAFGARCILFQPLRWQIFGNFELEPPLHQGHKMENLVEFLGSVSTSLFYLPLYSMQNVMIYQLTTINWTFRMNTTCQSKLIQILQKIL